MNTIERNSIGTDVTETAQLGNALSGVTISGWNNLVGDANDTSLGNIISGNGTNGVAILGPGAANNLVTGNFIGVAADGASPLRNGGNGVSISTGATSNIIGGRIGNVISSNGQNGILITDVGTNGNRVYGNYIGLDESGAYADGNTLDGVRIDGGSNNTIGGAQTAVSFSMRNVISANGGNGVTITSTAEDSVASGNVISGNYIGTDATGTVIADSRGELLGNVSAGVFIDNGQSNYVGADIDANSDAVNVISGNGTAGVSLGGNSQQNYVQGNYVGTNVTGTVGLPNASGISVSGTSNTIGDVIEDGRNLVSGNTGDGIDVFGSNIKVLYNWVGVNSSGNVGLGNSKDGILLKGAAAAILTANVIADNGFAGTNYAGLQLEVSNDAKVYGNYIGLGADGTTVLGNTGDGIYIVSSSGNVIGGNGANANYIAGTKKTSFGDRGYGIALADSAAGNWLDDNYIGFDAELPPAPAANSGGGINDASGGANVINIPPWHIQP
jgi:titin